ncbi:protein kinase domain protein [Penicillium sp. DV-2018c]|nr:protein kinase domain protein [Penicillium sp. DV-2018c]
MSATHLELKIYSEDEGFLVQAKAEPNRRSQTLIYHVNGTRWWIKVTLIGEIAGLLENGQIPQSSWRERRVLFQNLVRRINYEPLPLLADTVTELILEGDTTATAPNLEVGLVGTLGTLGLLNISLRYKIREDPLRVIYPAFADYPSFPKIHDEELIRDTEISDGVYRVYRKGRLLPYILKILNLPLYEPRDTHVLRKELENLEYFAGVPNIVQAEGVAVSTNPYKTSSRGDGPLVVTGILLKDYTGGSLGGFSCKTMLQIIDSEVNAVIIDISGIGGITRKWLSPELQDEPSPCDLSFEQRRLNDVWAYGKLLSEFALHAKDDPFANSLEQVAKCLMKDSPQSRMSLPRAISRLNGSEHGPRGTIL